MRRFAAQSHKSQERRGHSGRVHTKFLMRAHALLLVFACIALIGACSVSGRAHGADHHSRSHARVGSSSSSIVQEHTAYLFDAGVVDEGAQKCNKGNSTQWVLYKQCGESWSSDIIGTSTNTVRDDRGDAMQMQSQAESKCRHGLDDAFG